MYNLPNTENLQGHLDGIIHPYHSGEKMISTGGCTEGCTKCKKCRDKKSNAVGEVKILGMNPITFTIVAGLFLIAVGGGVIYSINHK